MARIDASCRVLLLPIISALVWLLISSVFALITSVKLHSPAILADNSWLTYGHTRPAANDAFVYGFASQAGLAIALWILCRLGRTSLFGGMLVAVASVFWNLGVTLGILGILAGHTTGFEWLEFPSAGSAILFASYVVFGICAVLTFRNREPGELYPSQWFILAALFWFPWLYTTARLLLFWFPARGVMQTIVNLWFANGLFVLWLGGLGIAILLYFIPKLARTPLHSHTLAIVAFWSLALFGGFAGFYRGLPLPAWVVSTGMAATAILLIPMLATLVNLWITLGESTERSRGLLSYFKASLVFFAISGVFAAFGAFVPQLRLTLFGEGTEQLFLYGFIGLALFGAIHYLVPLLTGVSSNRFVVASGGIVTLGLVIFVGAFVAGGMIQQNKLVNPAVPFAEIMNGLKPFIRVSTVGILLLVIGNAVMLARVALLTREWCRACCAGCCGESKPARKLKTAEAVR